MTLGRWRYPYPFGPSKALYPYPLGPSMALYPYPFGPSKVPIMLDPAGPLRQR